VLGRGVFPAVDDAQVLLPRDTSARVGPGDPSLAGHEVERFDDHTFAAAWLPACGPPSLRCAAQVQPGAKGETGYSPLIQ
jgi:hypothetical protein